MEVDHVTPEAAGGATDLNNLCLSCVGCNGFKPAFQAAIDPVTGEEAPLFNPRSQLWEAHFVWSEDGTKIGGRTPVGRATIVRLRMNRERGVEARQLCVAAGLAPTSPASPLSVHSSLPRVTRSGRIARTPPAARRYSGGVSGTSVRR